MVNKYDLRGRGGEDLKQFRCRWSQPVAGPLYESILAQSLSGSTVGSWAWLPIECTFHRNHSEPSTCTVSFDFGGEHTALRISRYCSTFLLENVECLLVHPVQKEIFTSHGRKLSPRPTIRNVDGQPVFLKFEGLNSRGMRSEATSSIVQQLRSSRSTSSRITFSSRSLSKSTSLDPHSPTS